MKQEIKDNSYYLTDEEGNVLLKLTPSDIPGNQVVIETNKEVYAGPTSLISFSENLKRSSGLVMNLQELIEKGYIEKIETESTHIGAGYNIEVKLHNYSIGEITVRVGIDESLDDAVTLINNMIKVDEDISKNKKPKENHTIRNATEEDLKKLFKD